MLKKIYYFSKTYKYDFLTAFAALILYILAFIFSDNQKILLILSIIITFIFFTIIIYIRFKEKDFYFIPLADRKNKDDWFGKGTFEYERTEKCFLITNSDSGYIYSKTKETNTDGYAAALSSKGIMRGTWSPENQYMPLRRYISFDMAKDKQLA